MKFKKILFVTPRYPFPVNGGDKLRITEIMKFLSKKNKVDLVSIGTKKQNIKFIKKQFLFNNNIFNKGFNIFRSLVKNEPLQIGLYKVTSMKKKINLICKNYDVIIFHLIRTSYYLPINFKGKKILEMTDPISQNYKTVDKNLSIINPLKYLYRYERKKLIFYESHHSKKFNKVVLVNKKDVLNSHLKKNKNLTIIGNGTHLKENVYYKNKIKNNIIFFGNINSLANRSACIDFINDYLPTLKKEYPVLEFKIFGNCSKLLKKFFKLKGVDISTNIKNLQKHCKNTLAGICNVKIHSGLQNKILDYTSIGLPIIINKESNNFKLLKGKNILLYNNKITFFKNIKTLLENSSLRKKISKTNYIKTRRYYNWNRMLKNYSLIVK